MNSYLLYLTGVVLLAIPSGALGRKRLGSASLHEIVERPRHRLGWLHLLNAIDLVRAYAGMTLLFAAFAALHPYAPGHLITRVMLALTALLGLLLQHGFHHTENDELPAPVAYILGLVFAILPPQIALLALPLGIVAALAFQNLGMGLALAAIATGVLGHLFGVSLTSTGTASLLLFCPVLLSGLLHRRLVLTVRRGPAVRQERFREIPLVESR